MITPLDIENKRFAKQMVNGYSVEEVDDFLDELTIDYSKNYKEVTELRAKVDELNSSLEQYKNIESTLQNTLVMAQTTAEEVKNVASKYKEFPTAMQGLGYKEVVDYLEGKCTEQEMIDKIKMETRRYAKRQLTWFRKNKQTIWLDGSKDRQNNVDIILEGIN